MINTFHTNEEEILTFCKKNFYPNNFLLVFQIEIFWRRALFADNNRVHCLVNADLLDYEVSDKGERTLERLMKNAESKGIKLLFITCIITYKTCIL